MPDIHPIKTIIWDLDGTLYKFDQAFIHACDVATAKSCSDQIEHLSFETALISAKAGFKDHNFSGYYLLRDYQIDAERFHSEFHLHINETLIHACEETQKLLKNIPLNMGIISHASKEWMNRTLEHLGLKQLFDDEHILAFEDYDFAHKAYETKSYEMMIDRLNANPEHTLMVEDSYKNLQGAKKAGLQTAYVHHARPISPLPEYIDKQFINIIDLIQRERL